MQNPRTYGEPPFRVALIHGGPGAGGEMAPVARRLSARFGVLEPIQTALSVEGQVSELHDILAHHAEPPVTLAGFSWGAWLALMVAARYPALVNKLILIASGALEDRYAAALLERRLQRLSEEESAEFLQALASLETAGGGEKDRWLARLGQLAAKADQYDHAEDAGIEPECIAPNARIYQRVWPEAAELRRSGKLLELAASVRCPVAVIHGAGDPSPVDGVVEPLRGVLPNLSLHVLDRCGHTPWLEKHARDEFYRALEEETGLERRPVTLRVS